MPTTSLVYDCISVLLIPITNIVNYSLQEDSFPSCLKTAHVTPLLKNPGLDRNTLKNYRPVSNLGYFSKLIEKALAKQINKHTAQEGILNINESACRAFQSTEMALLKIQNDIATSMDQGTAIGLVLRTYPQHLMQQTTQSYSIAFNNCMALMVLCLSGYSHTSTQGNSRSK